MEPEASRGGPGRKALHTLIGELGWWSLPSGLHSAWSWDSGLLPLGRTLSPGGVCLHLVHRVVDGSFLTRRWARIDDSIGLSWGVGLELLSAEYVAAMAP